MARNVPITRRVKKTNPAIELANSVVEPLPTRNENLQTPFYTQALFWWPHHPAMSPALAQLPFLFWLTESVRPRTIVQFGIGDGVVYMGLCQGSECLGHSTICLGIQAEEPILPPVMRAQHDARYSDFSELRNGDARTAIPQFSGEIDLLVLNQALDADTATGFRNNWLPLLSDRSVILLCHPKKVFPTPNVREILFPTQDQSIMLGPVSAGGHSVEVILHGKEQAERLVALASQRPGEHAYLITRQVFNRLGQGIEAIQKAEDVGKERDSLEVRLQSVQDHLKARETEIKGQHAGAKATWEVEAVEISRHAEMVARLLDVEKHLSSKSQQALLLSDEKAGLEKRIVEFQAQAATREAEHKVALGRYEEELVALRARLEASDAAKSALEAEFGKLKASHEEQTRQIPRLRERYEAEIEALHGQKSTLEEQIMEARAAHQERIRDIALLTIKHNDIAAGLRVELAASTTKISQMQQFLADLYKKAGKEIGQVVKALLPTYGLLTKKAKLVKQAKLLIDKEIVDPDWYLQHYADVAAAEMDPAMHYVLHGAEEGRLPRRALEDSIQGIR